VFKLDRIVGHDEVSPGRKTDPGAAMVLDGNILTLSELRDTIREDVERINS